jgi:membrane-associated phospholipid phosphatase
MMEEWKKFLYNSTNRNELRITVLLLILTLYFFLSFLAFAETRQGSVFNDPVLELFEPQDFSVITFILTYGCSIIGMWAALRNPSVFLSILQAYILLCVFRIITIYCTAFVAPPKIIPLEDFLLDQSLYQGRENLRDLFFSGHTATLLLFALCLKDRLLRIFFFIASALVGILLVMQHVHYSIDVVAAPFFSWLAVWLSVLIRNRILRS